jgi:serine protease AprX
MATTSGVSRQHTDLFLQRERKNIELLRSELGSEVVDKLDRILLRELIYEHKEKQLAQMFAVKETSQPIYEVMINARSGISAPGQASPPVTERKRRARLAEMRLSGEMAIARIEDDLKDHNVTVSLRLWLTHSVVATVTSDQMAAAAARGDVASLNHCKPEFAAVLDASRPLIKADQVASSLGFDGTGVTVAIIDTGIDSNHPALNGVVTSQTDLTGLGTGDGFGHGTHCAGIVASQDGTYTGIAPGAKLHDIRIMDNTGNTTAPRAVLGIQTAAGQGVGVASNSWGFSHANGAWVDANGTCVLCNAANAAVDAGVVIVVAAGNEDNDTCSTYDTHIRCPGIAEKVITVAASDKSDKMADFSSVGPTPDNRAKPDITAPGKDIHSCKAAGTSLGPTVDPAGNFITLSGTSMACPHVAGVAALMLDKNPKLTPARVKGIIMQTAVNIGATANQMGAGRVDALAAVNAS